MDLIKGITGKVVGGIVSACVIVTAISWWQSDAQTRETLLNGAGRIFSWIGLVGVIPWVTYFLIGRVARLESNAAGAVLVLGYTVLEAILLAYLFGWHFFGATGWTFAAAAVLIAGVYNLFTCDWIAEKLQQ